MNIGKDGSCIYVIFAESMMSVAGLPHFGMVISSFI